VLGVDRAAAIVDDARAAGDPSVEFRVADGYALDLPDASFDVVHAHQVLQHLTDPVAALREWRRVVRPGGVVAARDGDYASFTWYPEEPRLDRWLDLYRRSARANGAEPDAGRRLLAWAHAAGFTEVEAGASVWCFATPEDRMWWADLWADRIVESAVADQILAAGWADRATLADIAAGWRAWAECDDAWFLVPHGEIVAHRS
jgi:SAM-dependent methyltransferase